MWSRRLASPSYTASVTSSSMPCASWAQDRYKKGASMASCTSDRIGPRDSRRAAALDRLLRDKCGEVGFRRQWQRRCEPQLCCAGRVGADVRTLGVSSVCRGTCAACRQTHPREQTFLVDGGARRGDHLCALFGPHPHATQQHSNHTPAYQVHVFFARGAFAITVLPSACP